MDIKNSIRRNFTEDEIWNGSVSPTNKKPTIKVNFNVPNGSELRIYQSPSGHSWTYISYSVSGFGSREVGVNGSHYYVWFKSGDDDIAAISTYLIETINDEFSVSVLGMNFDEDGKLLVSGTGGATGGDASANNQVLQLNAATNSNLALFNQLSTQTDRVLFDTDLIYNQLVSSNTVLSSIDVSCNNMEVVLDNYTFTSGNLHVRDNACLAQQQASNLVLADIAKANEDILLSVDAINLKLNELQLQSAKYTIEASTSLAPQTVPAFTSPIAGFEKTEGWYFKNTGTNQPSQVYYYSYTNPALQVPGRQFPYQLNDISCGYCVVRLLSINATAGLPTLGIYTRPTGSGDAVPGFFKSRKVYVIPNTAKLTQGMKVLLYWGVQPSLKLHPGVSRVELQLASTTGTAAGTELLAYMTVNTDSAALAGNSEYILSAAGFQYGAELIMDSTFTGESSTTTTGTATESNQIASNTAVCARLDNSNTTLGLINTNLDQLTYSGSNLLVSDSRVLEQLQSSNLVQQTILEILGDSVPVINYGLLNDTPQYIPIKANSTGNLFVYDAEMHNLISPLVAFDRLQCEIPVSDGKLDTIINNMTLTNFNVNNLTKCDTDNIAIPGGVDINNLPTIQQVSLGGEAVSISGTVPISSGSPLDVHCYGSSDGVTFHHLKTNTQGVLKTNALLESDENGALTSELKTGTGAYNALHCWVKNSITLDAGSTTNITALDPIPVKSQSSQNTEIANDATVNGPVSIGTADTDGYLWLSAQIQMNEVTAAGTLYLEYSGEGSVWFRGNSASESVYVNTSVVQQRVLIRPQTPCTMRYVRIYAEGTFAATGVSAWVGMK
jgi:hypothetical protein